MIIVIRMMTLPCFPNRAQVSRTFCRPFWIDYWSNQSSHNFESLEKSLQKLWLKLSEWVKMHCPEDETCPDLLVSIA